MYMLFVDARLNALRAGDELTDAGPFLRYQSLPGGPLLRSVWGVEDRRGGEGWLRSEEVDLLPSERSGKGGLRLSA